MDEMQPDGRDAFHAFNVYPPDSETAKEQSALCYRQFKARVRTLMEMLPQQDSFVFGLVCFILGNRLARSTRRVFHFIERRRGDAADDPSAKESLDALREEEHLYPARLLMRDLEHNEIRTATVRERPTRAAP